MFMELKKVSSSIDFILEIYDKVQSALKDYYETYLLHTPCCNLHFNVSYYSREIGWYILVVISGESFSSILEFCDDFNYFLDNNFLYEDLSNFCFNLRTMRNDGSGFASACAAQFICLVPFESGLKEQSREGGEG